MNLGGLLRGDDMWTTGTLVDGRRMEVKETGWRQDGCEEASRSPHRYIQFTLLSSEPEMDV